MGIFVPSFNFTHPLEGTVRSGVITGVVALCHFVATEGIVAGLRANSARVISDPPGKTRARGLSGEFSGDQALFIRRFLWRVGTGYRHCSNSSPEALALEEQAATTSFSA